MGCTNHQSIHVIRETCKRALKCEIQNMRVLLLMMEILFSNTHFYAQQLMHCFSSFCNRQSLKIWPAVIGKTSTRSHLVNVKLIVRATKPLAYICEEGLGRNALSNLLCMLLCTCSCTMVISLISCPCHSILWQSKQKCTMGIEQKKPKFSVLLSSFENLSFAP